MPLKTRLTARLDIDHPILLAPMAFVSGGKLAAAVTRAGGLGLIGGGYGDEAWLAQQFAAAGNARVGCGFITWSMAKNPRLLDVALDHKPSAVMLSFGDPVPFASRIKASGAQLICQVQTLAHAERAIDAGADIVVAQGGEAGGHGARQATMPFVPAVVDLVEARARSTLVVAAGGIADGRGLAAALMLGAEGVLVGTRFWAADEALVHPAAHARAIAASGGDTVRTTVFDTVRRLDWPAEFDIRVLRNGFIDRWHGDEAGLDAARETEIRRFEAAVAAADYDIAGVVVGEAVGLVRNIQPAAQIVEEMVTTARHAIDRRSMIG